MKEHLRTLGVEKIENKGQLKKAYRKKAMQTHPDIAREASPDQFVKIRTAYEKLLDYFNAKNDLPVLQEEYKIPPEKSFEEYMSEKIIDEQMNLLRLRSSIDLFLSRNPNFSLSWYYPIIKTLFPFALFVIRLTALALMLCTGFGFLIGYSRLFVVLIVPLTILGVLLYRQSGLLKNYANELFSRS